MGVHTNWPLSFSILADVLLEVKRGYRTLSKQIFHYYCRGAYSISVLCDKRKRSLGARTTRAQALCESVLHSISCAGIAAYVDRVQFMRSLT